MSIISIHKHLGWISHRLKKSDGEELTGQEKKNEHHDFGINKIHTLATQTKVEPDKDYWMQGKTDKQVSVKPNTSRFITCKVDLPDDEYWWERDKELEKTTGIKMDSTLVFVVSKMFKVMVHNVKNHDNIKIINKSNIGIIKPILDEEEPMEVKEDPKVKLPQIAEKEIDGIAEPEGKKPKTTTTEISINEIDNIYT